MKVNNYNVFNHPVLSWVFTPVSGVGSNPTWRTCETSQVCQVVVFSLSYELK